MRLYVLLLILVSTSIYGQEVQPGAKSNTIEIMEQKMKDHTAKTEAKWKYNPFRVSAAEKKLVG